MAAPLALLFFWILGYQLHPGFFGPEKPRFSLEIADSERLHIYAGNSLFRKACNFYKDTDRYVGVELYNANVEAKDIVFPSILDRVVYDKVKEQLPEDIEITSKNTFTGINIIEYFILEEK